MLKIFIFKVCIFSDASERAYGTVTYLKLPFTDDTSTVSFVMWKSWLAPVKTVPLPRLEMNATQLFHHDSHDI